MSKDSLFKIIQMLFAESEKANDLYALFNQDHIRNLLHMEDGSFNLHMDLLSGLELISIPAHTGSMHTVRLTPRGIIAVLNNDKTLVLPDQPT